MSEEILTNQSNLQENRDKKLQENDTNSSENAKTSNKNNAVVKNALTKMSSGTLGTIQETEDSKDNESSDSEVSSLTSDTDSAAEAMLSDSTDEEVERFPSKKLSKQRRPYKETVESQNNGLEKQTNSDFGSEANTFPAETYVRKPSTEVNDEAATFPSKKLSKQKSIHNDTAEQQNSELVKQTNSDFGSEANTFSAETFIRKSSTEVAKNINDPNSNTDGGVLDSERKDTNVKTLPEELSAAGSTTNRPEMNGHEKQHDSELQLKPSTSNESKELSASGSSDVVLSSGKKREPPDLIKGNRNSSETVYSDDSDMKDHARILAELQKLVDDDQTNDDNDISGGTNELTKNLPEIESKDSGKFIGQSSNSSSNTSVDNNSKLNSDAKTSNDSSIVRVRKNDRDDGTSSTKVVNIGTNQSDSTDKSKVPSSSSDNSPNRNLDSKKSDSISNSHQTDGKSSTNIHLSNSGTKLIADPNNAGRSHDSKNGDTFSDNGGLLDRKSGTQIQSESNDIKLTSGNESREIRHSTLENDGSRKPDGNKGAMDSNNDRQQGEDEFDNDEGKSDVNLQNVQRNESRSSNTAEVNKNRIGTSKSEPVLFSASVRANQPVKLTNKDLENLERKLAKLQTSNNEQTDEIRRLKALNQSLKTKFEKLEQSSSKQQHIEEKMLQRNEELEKHLLGMLKSQEIIFDMKENLKTASADNEKLSKDYKEAVKALEAVDKLFGQKDALVTKWKEANEESRRLVELLKRHNAEEGELETVDKLKEEIAFLKNQISKAEEANRRANAKNEALLTDSKAWKEKYERENEQAIKLDVELQSVTKELKNQQKLSGKRGRKNQVLQLQITELKDTLKLAKEKLVENERRLKEMERKYADIQEMYTKIIHEKEMQQSVLIKNSEFHQKDLVAKIENSENLRKEAGSLKEQMVALEKQKMEIEGKLKNNEKSLEESLNQKQELNTQLAKLQSDFEAAKIEAVDTELFSEEQTVRLRELEQQCIQLQTVLRQYIQNSGTRKLKRPSTAPGRCGRRIRNSQTWPSQLDMYRQILTPPRGLPRRRSPRRDAKYRVQITDKNDEEDNDTTQKYDESQPTIFYQTRPKSTYGNRSLSTNQKEDRDREHNSKDWAPKIVLVDSQKLESEHDSGSVSADQYAMQYVKLGDRVLVELVVDGKKQNLPGIVKYVGPVYHSNFKSGIYAGLKLDISAGDTNGTVGGRVYFECLKKRGKFVKLSHILAVQNPRTQQYTRVLPMAYK